MTVKVGSKVKIKVEGLDFEGMFEETRKLILEDPERIYEIHDVDESQFYGYPIGIMIGGSEVGFLESELILVEE